MTEDARVNYELFAYCTQPLCSDISPDPMLEALALRNKLNSNELGAAEGQQNDPTEAQSAFKPLPEAEAAAETEAEAKAEPSAEKVVVPDEKQQPATTETKPAEESKPKRGRPRKKPIIAALDGELKPPKRGRGRPRTKTGDWPCWLPNDWQIIQKTRQHGRSVGHVDKYYINPYGQRFRSKKDVLTYMGISSAEGDKKQHTVMAEHTAVMADDLIGQ